MSGHVKRYALDKAVPAMAMIEHVKGGWVKHSDHKKAVARLAAAIDAALPFIDDANDIAQFFPDSAATEKCRAAVAELKAARKECE